MSYCVVLDNLEGLHVPVAGPFDTRDNADTWRGCWRQQYQCAVDPFHTVEVDPNQRDASLKIVIAEPVLSCAGNG